MEPTDSNILSFPNSSPERHYFSFHGDGFALAGVMLKNIFFTLITLGFYSPWGRTNTRRYFWSNTAFKSDRFSYTGTGTELFKGWIRVIGILFLAFLIVGVVTFLLPTSMKLLPNFLVPFIYIYIFAIAIYSGLRYRALRTLWRQIRFNVIRDKKMANDFTLLMFKGCLLSALTLGIYLPFFTNKKHTFLFNKITYGGLPFSYTGSDNEYFKLCLKGFLLSILTFGFYAPWFFLSRFKFRLKHTHLGQNSFHLNLKGEKLFAYFVASYFGTIFSFGLALPWILNWGFRLIFNNLYLEGPLDIHGVRNEDISQSAAGDDLVSAYDIDLGF